MTPTEGQTTTEAKGEQVKCTRCRHVHYEKDRVKGKPDKYGLTPIVCPKCSGHSMYRTTGAKTP